MWACTASPQALQETHVFKCSHSPLTAVRVGVVELGVCTDLEMAVAAWIKSLMLLLLLGAAWPGWGVPGVSLVFSIHPTPRQGLGELQGSWQEPRRFLCQCEHSSPPALIHRQ